MSLLLCCAALSLASAASAPGILGAPAPSPLSFLRANGSALLADGRPYRFGGVNLYWLGLDENEGGIHLPTPFRVTDGLTTVAGVLPGTVLRAHTLGISTGSPLSFEPALGVFNHSNLAAADFAIAEAERLGLRVIVPLTDNWRYYHGGKHNFVEWCGGTDEALFYTDACAIAAFKDYIKERLAHVNPFTGRRASDEPAIGMWETGNVSAAEARSDTPRNACALSVPLTRHCALFPLLPGAHLPHCLDSRNCRACQGPGRQPPAAGRRQPR